MNYQQKIEKVIEFIGLNLDEDLSLDRLSDISFISKFHLHRLFTAFTGLSLHQYIKWLRLKRAARQLMVNKDQSIIDIAMNAGLESHEAFTRAFKKTCGMSPKQYRQHANTDYWEQTPYSLSKLGSNKMNVEIKESPAIRLAVVEHRGDPRSMATSINQLITWAKSQSLALKPEEAFSVGYHDPKTIAPEEFHHDLGIKIPENVKLHGKPVTEKYLPAGRYATAMHKGSHQTIADTIYYVYRHWLPQSHEELGDFPCVFCYHNFDHEVAETELLTEVRILLKD